MGVLYYNYIEKHLENYYKSYVKMHTLLLKKVTILYYFYLTFLEILKMFSSTGGKNAIFLQYSSIILFILLEEKCLLSTAL